MERWKRCNRSQTIVRKLSIWWAKEICCLKVWKYTGSEKYPLSKMNSSRIFNWCVFHLWKAIKIVLLLPINVCILSIVLDYPFFKTQIKANFTGSTFINNIFLLCWTELDGGLYGNFNRFKRPSNIHIQHFFSLSSIHSVIFKMAAHKSAVVIVLTCWFRWWKTSSRENRRMDQKEERKWLLPKHISGVKSWRPNGIQRYVPHECH